MSKSRMTIRLDQEPPRGTIEERSVRLSGVPKTEDHNIEVDLGSYYRPRAPKASLWKLIGSITAAVLTGLLFGFAVLNSFGGEPRASEHTKPVDSVPVPEAAQSQQHDAAGVQPGSEAVLVPDKTYYLLQYGMFSSEEGAKQAEKELLQSGLAAYGDMDGAYRVYAGISPDREGAKLLSSQLKHSGIELYVKEVVSAGPQTTVLAVSGLPWSLFIETGGGLASELSAFSALMLGRETGTAADAETMNRITGLHLQWTEALELLQGMSPEAESQLKGMAQQMNSAVTALAEYNKNQAKGHLWEIQSGMMNYIMGQKKLISLL
ncbi:SPOR domain-containing protein [Paenibacillus sp. F411]|uniref:SPOR domain-containing protein n=1 Tax=Paenibacillus sp. F411 TaxID=2820239 RepID=UPI001AAFF0DA|nr:SPOR domain-containing protein [Paenibacillus sp. F411]MBO2943943.1 SPOR domain-containing protein [Paenibacillus sp. F411]